MLFKRSFAHCISRALYQRSNLYYFGSNIENIDNDKENAQQLAKIKEEAWDEKDIESIKMRSELGDSQDVIKMAKKLDNSITIESSDISKFVNDPRQNENLFTLDSKNFLDKKNQLFDNTSGRLIRTESNSLINEAIKEGQIKLEDERVQVKPLEISQSFLMNSDMTKSNKNL